MAGRWQSRRRVRRMPRRHRAGPGYRGWVLLATLIVGGGLTSLFAVRGMRIVGLRAQLDEAQASYERAIDERGTLEQRWAQRDDLSVLEDEARRKLGWVLPGEVRVIFVDPATGGADQGE